MEEEDEEEDSVASDTESGSEKELEKLGNKVLPKKSSKKISFIILVLHYRSLNIKYSKTV